MIEVRGPVPLAQPCSSGEFLIPEGRLRKGGKVPLRSSIDGQTIRDHAEAYRGRFLALITSEHDKDSP